MSALSGLMLTSVVAYGAPIIGLTLLLGAIGLPLPTSLLVIAMGAFIRQGELNGALAAGLGVLGAVLGDSLSYAIGYYGGRRVTKYFDHKTTWLRAQETFTRFGGLAIFLTRFLLTSLALPVNWVAAGSGYSFRRFFFYSLAGEITWVALYSGLGYVFGAQWELVSDFIANSGGLLLGIVALAAGLGLAVRYWKLKRGLTKVFSALPGDGVYSGPEGMWKTSFQFNRAL